MNLTELAYGSWSGGRYMHFGETLDEQRYKHCIEYAYECGIRTFVTSDVYGNGRADALVGEALKGVERSSYCLVGSVGHDFYNGQRNGAQGYPRFTDPALRAADGYHEFLQMATEKSLERCQTDYFDCLLLHNPCEIGYTSPEVWSALAKLREQGLTKMLGIAPGPANGFTLDLIHCFEQYGEVIDWAMLILNPLEPWPVSLCLDAANAHDVKVLTRVVDYGGIFHDDLKPGHEFRPGDHRAYRPAGWVERGCEKLEQMRPYAERHGLSMLQFASIWNLSHPAVNCVVPTFVQETGEQARPIEDKILDFSRTPVAKRLSELEVAEIAALGDNTGSMMLKGASARHAVSERPDEWPMRPELLKLAQRYDLAGYNW